MAIDQNLTAVLKPYGVYPRFAESFGRVQKVYTEKGTLAVKKIPAAAGVDFVRNVQHLFQSGYHRIVPIYPTLDGRYAVWHEDELYYVMPWLSNEVKENRFERHQTLFRELARLHTLSSKEQKISKEEREEHYETLNSRWEKEQSLLEEYIEICEKEWYMSPFQLSYCMYYSDTSQALKFARKKFDSWYEETKEQEKVRSVVVHGKISSEHFLYDERGAGYFVNFENTRIASPIHDLLPFLSRTLKTYPKAYDECFDWLMTYCNHFSFRKEEKLLFLSYLAYPSGLISTVKKYHETPRQKRNEIKFLRKLQHQHWLLKNTEYIVMKWEEWEQRKREAQENNTQEGASSS